MTDKAVDLDHHRGMAAQKATGLRRLLAEVAANERALRATQDELEAQLIAAPASNWEEVADKVCYLLSVLAATPSGQDPRRKKLIQAFSTISVGFAARSSSHHFESPMLFDQCEAAFS